MASVLRYACSVPSNFSKPQVSALLCKYKRSAKKTTIPYITFRYSQTCTQILSSLSAIPPVLATALMNANGYPKSTVTRIVTFVLLALEALRCPMAVGMTFKAKTETDLMDRERRRQREREEAIKARKERNGVRNKQVC